MYSHAVLGGTFDHLHLGHQDLIDQALATSAKLTIGITKVSLNKHKLYSSQIQSYTLRQAAVYDLIRGHKRENDVTILPITNLYGSTLENSTLEAIFVTAHSLDGANQINHERVRLGLHPLQVEHCALRTDETGEVLSSSRIRAGIVNRLGSSYLKRFSAPITLDESSKLYFKRPFGKTTGARKLRQASPLTVVVGDIATRYCMEHQIPFNRAYIDGQSKRQAISIDIAPNYQREKVVLSNLPGQISTEVISDLVHNTLESTRKVVSVRGEEDLVTVAAVIVLPLGTRVVYGYPFSPSSLRVITVTERIKEAFFAQLTL